MLDRIALTVIIAFTINRANSRAKGHASASTVLLVVLSNLQVRLEKKNHTTTQQRKKKANVFNT